MSHASIVTGGHKNTLGLTRRPIYCLEQVLKQISQLSAYNLRCQVMNVLVLNKTGHIKAFITQLFFLVCEKYLNTPLNK